MSLFTYWMLDKAKHHEMVVDFPLYGACAVPHMVIERLREFINPSNKCVLCKEEALGYMCTHMWRGLFCISTLFIDDGCLVQQASHFLEVNGLKGLKGFGAHILSGSSF